VHGEAAEQAIAGQRTALNLAGVAVEDLARGVMLAPPETFRETQRVDVSLSLLPSAKPLKDRARVHLHAYTSETVAEVGLYGEKIIKPGQNAYAQLRMDARTLLLPGDRFIVRQFSPVVTIGGGVVLDATPPLRSKKGYFLKLLDEGMPERIIEGRIARQSNRGLTVPQLVAETGWLPTSIRRHLAESIRRGQILQLGDRYLHGAVVEVLRESIVSGVTAFHKENPLVAGISKEHLRETVATPPEVLAAMLDLLTSEKKLELAGDLVRLPGRGVVLKDEEAESKKIIEQAFSSVGLQVPALYNVLAGLKVDKARAQKIVTLLLRDKVLIKISDELVFHQSALQQLRGQLAAYKAKSARIDVGKFKELTGVSRKYAIPLLEYLDRERVTKRVGDERVIL
jgi:selenocysteine-specific elongation factor